MRRISSVRCDVMGFGLVLLTASLFFIVGIGFAIIIVKALPFLQDKVHDSRIVYLSFVSHEVGTWFHFKLEMLDLMAAFNPVNVSIRTGACNPDIKVIQLHFEGARKYFIGDYNFSDPEMFEKLQHLTRADIVHLERDSLTTFAGNIMNLTYTSGGEFDIGITITKQNGHVEGYGLGNTDYALKKAIQISPPEALVQLRNSRLTTGLAYTAIGLTLFGVGLAGIISLMIRYFMA